MKTGNLKSLLLTMLLLSYTTTAFISFFLVRTAKAQAATMWVTPSTNVYEKGDTFSITIWLNDTGDPGGPYDVKSWALTLSFDGSVLDFIGATEGSYLKSTGASTYFVPAPPHSIPVTLVCAITTSGPGVEGPGDLVSVTFKAIDNGRTIIDLKDTELLDSSDAQIFQAEPSDGLFYTTYPKASYYYLPSTTAQSISGIPTPFHLARDPLVNETITFNATAYMLGASFKGSYDPNTASEGDPTGSITNYVWDFDDGNVTSGNYPVIVHSFTATNTYNVNLTVTDNDAKSSWFSSAVTSVIRDVRISHMEVSPTIVSPGETVSIKVNITNYGSISANELVNVTLYQNDGVSDTLIPYNVTEGLKMWSNVHVRDPVTHNKPMAFLPTNPPITLNYTWNTGGLPGGNYTLWANISQVDLSGASFLRDLYFREMDLNLTNNEMTWGEVKISELHNVAISEVKLTPTLKSPNIIDYGITEVALQVKTENTGDFDETFNVTLHQDSSLLTEWINVFLASKTSILLNYTWPTSALSRGYYNLTAQASNATGEIENGRTGDNKLVLKVLITSAPVVTFTYSPTKPIIGNKINVDASASYAAPGASITKYTWYINATEDKTVQTAVGQLSQLLQSRTTWNVTLVVTDNATVSSSLSKFIHVGSLPVAQFTFTPTAPKADQTVTFDATSSTPDTPPVAGDTIHTYSWDFGDGAKVVYTGANLTKATTHSYARSGNFSAILKVFDGDEFNATITKFVIVTRITTGTTVNLNAQTIEVGESVTISGQVTPTRTGAKVSILYKTDTADWTMLQNVTSDQAGSYQYVWTINTAGNYTVKARFSADDKYATSESQTAAIQVQTTPEPEPTFDWTPYIIGGAIVTIIVVAIAVYLMKRR